MKVLNLIVITIMITLISCQKEDLIKSQSNEDVRVENGRLIFKDVETYKKISELISTYSNEEIDLWCQKAGVNSSHLAYSNFIKGSADAVEKLSEKDLKQFIIDNYSTKISITYDDDKMKVQPRFDFFKAFANLDGEFMVGKNLFKIFKNSFFIIEEGHYDNAAFLNERSEISEGIWKYFPTVKNELRSPCNSNSDEYFIIPPANGRKLTVSYSVVNYNIQSPNPLNPNLPIWSEFVDIAGNASHEKKKTIFSYWGCDPTSFGFYVEIRVSHNYGSPVQPEFVVYGNDIASSRCYGGVGGTFFAKNYASVLPFNYSVYTTLVWLDFDTASGRVQYYCGV